MDVVLAHEVSNFILEELETRNRRHVIKAGTDYIEITLIKRIQREMILLRIWTGQSISCPEQL